MTDRQAHVDQLRTELTSIGNQLADQFDTLYDAWDDLSLPERFAASSVKNAVDAVERALDELNGNL